MQNNGAVASGRMRKNCFSFFFAFLRSRKEKKHEHDERSVNVDVFAGRRIIGGHYNDGFRELNYRCRPGDADLILTHSAPMILLSPDIRG